MAEITCGKCGSQRVIPGAKVVSCAERPDLGLRAVVARKPGAAFFRGEVETKLSVRVCGDCGFAELFADEAGALFDAYSEAKRAVLVDNDA